MRKVFLIGIVAAAFFAGTFFTAFSIADGENGGNNAWAKLVARVAALEEKPANNMIIVELKDDDVGHAAGWNPNGLNVDFIISETRINEHSIIYATATASGFNDRHNLLCGSDVMDSGVSFSIQCAPPGGTEAPVDGAVLHYTITNPS